LLHLDESFANLLGINDIRIYKIAPRLSLIIDHVI